VQITDVQITDEVLCVKKIKAVLMFKYIYPLFAPFLKSVFPVFLFSLPKQMKQHVFMKHTTLQIKNPFMI